MKPRTVLALLLLVPHVALAAGPPTDRNGDPLPEGAVARFGSGRLLHGYVRHVEFAPDGKALATSGDDGARLWDVATGKEIVFAYLPRTGEVVLTFTSDGAHVVGDGKGCRVVEPATGKVRCSWRNPGKRPREVVVAADGKSAVTAWEEGGVTVTDLTGVGKRPSRTLSEDETELLALSGDGGLLAYAREKGKEKAILLWDVRKGKLLHTHRAAKDDRIFSLCLSRDGRRLAASGEDYEFRIRLWDTASHEMAKGFVGPTKQAVFLRFSPDGGELVGVSPERDVVRWSAATGKELARSGPPPGQEDWAAPSRR
jgi:WD40 repeat protein